MKYGQCFPVTHSSSPRKDVSIHTPQDKLTGSFWGLWSSAGQPLEARSELTDVRSVLRSKDVQEAEETDGLVSTFSSCETRPRSMVREEKCKGQEEGREGHECMKEDVMKRRRQTSALPFEGRTTSQTDVTAVAGKAL